jgi:hypothetical protein
MLKIPILSLTAAKAISNKTFGESLAVVWPGQPSDA